MNFEEHIKEKIYQYLENYLNEDFQYDSQDMDLDLEQIKDAKHCINKLKIWISNFECEGRDEDEETEDCPHCGYKHQIAEATYLRKGFNGIQEGDEDDKDCFECIQCGKEFGQK